MTAMAPAAPRRSGPLMLLAPLPWLFLAAALLLYQVPDEVRAAGVPLVGTWQVRHGDGPRGPTVPPVEGPWLDRSLPDTPESPSLEGTVTWLKRTVELPAPLRASGLYLRLGGLRGASWTVYWNGHQIADEPAFGGKEGWSVPTELVRPTNEVAVRARWSSDGDHGFEESRWMVGDARVLAPYFARFEGLRTFVFSGVLFALPFAFAMIWVLRAQAGESTRRKLYGSLLTMIPGAGLYVVFMTTSVLSTYFHPTQYLPLLTISVAAMMYGFVNFTGWYFDERRTRLALVSSWVCALAAGLSLLAMAIRSEGLAVAGYAAFMATDFVLAIIIVVTVFRRRDSTREAKVLRYLLIFAFSGYLLAGLADITLEARLHSLPRLFPFSTANLVVAILSVVIADFIGIAQTNKKLSVSLQVANDELSVAVVAATEAARVKGEFVANMSHELRTPLNSIINVPSSLVQTFARAETLRCGGCGSQFEPEGDEQVTAQTECPECQRKGTLTPQAQWRFLGEAKEALRRMQALWRSAMHLLSLVDGVLDFSKIDAGRMTLRVRPVSVSDTLLGVASTVSSLAEARRLALQVIEPAADFEIRADPTRLAQVLMNLASNALKFTPEGKTIALGAERRGDKCHFWVKDEGIGVAPEHHQLIFESFRQIDSSHTRPYGGTGLGLAIAQALVKLHDGRLWVESAAGEGATFHLELPVVGPASKPEVLDDADAIAGRRVFVASDDPLAVNAVRLALHPLGVNVTGTADLSKVPEMLRTQHPDLLIVDAVGEGDRALALCEAWGQRASAAGTSAAPEMQVLALGVEPEEKRPFETSGAQTLGAPWRTEQLAERVMRLLEVRA